MLTFLREGAKSGFLKYILLGFMGLAVMGLVFIDMTGSFRDGVSSNSVARVGDGEISTAQMTQALQNAERQSGMIDIPQKMREALARKVVDQEIQRRIYALEAHDMGLIIPDTLAAHRIKDQLGSLTENGFTEEEALAQLLRSTGMSEQQLIRAYKQDVAVGTLVQSVAGGIYAPEEMITTAYKYQNQKRAGDVITISKSRFKNDIKTPADSDLKSYYDDHLSDYMTPEYREISYMIMTEDSIKHEIDTSDDVLQKVYDERIDEYTLPPRRIVDQAVFQSADLAQDVVAKSTDAKSLMAALQDIDEKEYILLNDEPITEDDISIDLVDAAFETPLGEISGPIQTSLGWVVMAVKSEQDETVQPFKDVKDELAEDYKRQKSEEVYYETANEIDEMLTSGMEVSQIAEEYELPVYQTPLLLNDGKTKDGKTAEIMQQKFAEELLQEAFELKAGDMPPLMETADGRFVAFSVTEIVEPQAKPFDSVKADVLKNWTYQKLTEKMVELSKEVFEKAQDGTSLKSLSDQYKLDLKSYTPMTAKTMIDDKIMDQKLAERLFALDNSGDVDQMTNRNESKLIQLTKIIFPASTDLDETQHDQYKQAIGERIRSDLQMQYETALRQKYDVKISDNAIKRAVAPVDEDF